jgi:hypothetical protein
MIKLFPARERWLITTRLGTGKSLTFFYGVCTYQAKKALLVIKSNYNSGIKKECIYLEIYLNKGDRVQALQD